MKWSFHFVSSTLGHSSVHRLLCISRGSKGEQDDQVTKSRNHGPGWALGSFHTRIPVSGNVGAMGGVAVSLQGGSDNWSVTVAFLVPGVC